MDKYMYKGTVKSFDEIIARDYVAQTFAESKEKALSNISYQYKKKHNMDKWSKIVLDEKYLAKVPIVRY